MESEPKLNFENSLVDLASLPQLESANFQKLEEDYLWFKILNISILFIIVAGASIIYGISSKFQWWQPVVVVSVLFLIMYLVAWKGFKVKGYTIRQNDVTYKSGLLFFSMTSVPFNRVQHTEVYQGPIARLFNLSEVKIYTAGGSSSDLSIPGLKVEDAHRLKDYITELSSKYA